MSDGRWAVWTLLCLTVTLLWRTGKCYNTTCIPPKPQAGSVHLPVVSGQFTVHVEATFVDKNLTMDFVEYFDYNNNRGRLRQMKSGITTDYYYDYKTNELLVVSPDAYSCQVQNLSTASYTFLLGDSHGHVFSPAAALRFGSQTGYPFVYIGKSTVRGIRVNQWSSCLNWPKSNTFMQVTWSFVDNMAWVASASLVNVPVMCHVTGKVYSQDQQSYRSFEHLYEFIHFNDNIPPEESEDVFETPSGILCPGRKNTQPLTFDPSIMSYTGETANEGKKKITYTQEKFDSRDRLVVYKMDGHSAFSDKFGHNPLAVVNDFNTGSEYVIDIVRGNCTISVLSSSTSDVTHTSDLMTLRMQSARILLNLNATYTYQGKRTVRGMSCDVWSASKGTRDMFSGIMINVTIEWAFAKGDWNYVPTSGTGVPVQVVYIMDDFHARQTSETNIYDYESGVGDILEGVNIDGCFLDLPRNSITLSISRTYRDLLETSRREFKRAVRRSIAQTINVSPLRVANVQYTTGQMSLDIHFDLLSVPAVHSPIVNPAKELPLEWATKSLDTAVKNSLMSIEFDPSPGKSVPTYFPVDPNSLRIIRHNQDSTRITTGPSTASTSTSTSTSTLTSTSTSPKEPSFPYTTLTTAGRSSDFSSPVPHPDHQGICDSSDNKGYSVGVMVGSSLAMGVVGSVLGGVTHRLIVRHVS